LRKSLLILAIGAIIFINAAHATTVASASTSSEFSSDESDAYVFRTISNNLQCAPDFSFRSMGMVNTLVLKDPGGSSETTQKMYFSANNIENQQGYCSQSNEVVGTNIKKVDAQLNSNLVMGIFNGGDPTKVESSSIGAGLVAADSDLYSLSVTGGHTTRTNAALIPVPIESLYPTTYSLTYDIDPVEFDTPAEEFNQDVNVKFGVSNNELDYYAYDFSRVILLDDIGFMAEMTVIHDE
jgi:hypothetical protein